MTRAILRYIRFFSKPTSSEGWSFGALVLVIGVLSLVLLDSCAGLKKSTKTNESTTDTTKIEAVSQIDSITDAIGNTVGKVKDFFSGLSSSLSGKDSVILIHPRSTLHPEAEVVDPNRGDFPPSPILRKVEFDSSGSITLHDQMLGADVTVPQTYTLDQYLDVQRDEMLREGYRKSAQKYSGAGGAGASKSGGAGGKEDQPGGILSDYGSISIPIPPSIVPTIFGKPSINLRVNGDVAIHLAYRDNQFLQTTGAYFSGSETGLDFRQEVNMSLSGSIGEKVKISTDFGSLRQFSFDNLFKLSYQGYPDEIIQSVEAGNVSLTTPSKYIGVQSALFGFKSVMRFGPMYLTAIAAQKKGERQSKSFGGGPGSSAGTDFVIQPANYRRNRYFLDTSFIARYEQVYSKVTLPLNGGNVINQGTVELWRSTTNTTDVRIRHAHMFYNLPPASQAPGGSYELLRNLGSNQGPPYDSKNLYALANMVKVDTGQYSVDPVTGIITMYQEPYDRDVYAVSYQLPSGEFIGEPSGGTDGSDAKDIVLKLLKPADFITDGGSSAPEWKNLLKNSYYVGATNVDPKSFGVKIIYTFPTGTPYELVHSANGSPMAISVMGLDRFNNSSGAPGADGAFDVINGESALLDTRTGTLIFPQLEPFGQNLITYLEGQKRFKSSYHGDSTFYYPIIYEHPHESLRGDDLTKNNYISINVKYSGGSSSVINLNAFNIVDGSVRVSVGGQQLVENVDYRVDVNSGVLTLLKPDLASAGQINVEYDTHDIFTTSTKTLVGLRAEIPIVDHGLLGFSMMNYSMHLPTIKTRQGEEPMSNMIIGTDASYKISLPSLTDLLNDIPIFNLRDKSEINFKFDAALSLPNPNTEKSPMAVDNGASIAYLDDFEGGRNEFPLSMNYSRWVAASPPSQVPYYVASGLTDSQVVLRKSKSFWYAAQPSTPIHEIIPNKSVANPNEPASVLDMVFDPNRRGGIYNPHPDSSELAQYTWAGMMQYQQGLNVAATNTDAIEFWMNVPELDGIDRPNAKLLFDIGAISEDVIPDGRLETEDRNGNGRYDPGEDNGLDTISSAEEKTRYNLPDVADPSNDDYSYTTNSGVYDQINGTEGNSTDAVSGSVRLPDTEDLNSNSSLDVENSYYEYEIPLNPVGNPFIIGNTNNSWYQFRIPLTSFERTVGSVDSSFSNLKYFRLWLTGYNKRVHMRFYDIGLFGSQWTRGLVDLNPNNPVGDTSFSINYVSIENNQGPPTNYTSPPGAQRDQLAGSATLVYGNEQSIALQLRCVKSSERREAIRIFPSPNDLFNYRAMGIWVHGGDGMPATVTDTNNRVWVYFRFGGDKYNYYEYRRPLTSDWSNIHIDFLQLAALKATRTDPNATVFQAANDGFVGSYYRIVGSPNVTNAPYFVLGVQNETPDNCLTTEVWFDELRLLEANDKTDYAINGSIQTKLAEFGSVTTNFVYERPDFHRVDERFNTNRALTSGWGITGEFQMQKILPSWLERSTKFPLVVSHTETMLKPKYIPNTDVEVQSAVDKISALEQDGTLTAEQAKALTDSITITNETLTVRNAISATGVQFIWPGKFFLLPLFVNRLVYGFGYGEEFTRSPVYEYYRNWSWTGSLGYDLPIPNPPSVSPLTWVGSGTFDIGRYAGWKLNFLPNRLTLAASVTRSRLHYLNRISTLVFFPGAFLQDSIDILNSRQQYINRAFTSNRTLGFNWKLTENGLLSPQIDYFLDVTSNLGSLETYNQPNQEAYLNAQGNVVYPYDSVYYYQRPFKSILSDIFFTNGKLINPGKDYLAIQRVKISTSPRLPWLFWVDKYIRPVFSYNVEYKWFDAQAGFQSDRTGQWKNTINTGFELNLREFGIDIFGRDEPAKKSKVGGRSVVQEDPSMIPGRPGQPFDSRQPSGVRRVGDAPGKRPQSPPPLTTQEEATKSTPVEDTLNHVLGVGTEGLKDDLSVSDTTLIPVAPAAQPQEEVTEEPPLITPRDVAKALLQTPFTDWNGTRFNFIQNNYSLNGALQGSGSGITNFLARGIFTPEDDALGPSRAYQMGLITDPHGRLLINFVPKFPFVHFGVRPGLRQGNATGYSVDINDVFTQTNSFELTTSRPLWAGASISLNWKTEFGYDERDALRIGPDGSITPLQITKTGDVSRTFLSIPPLPFLNISQSGIKRVGQMWRDLAASNNYTTQANRDTMNAKLKNELQRKSFMEGFETLPLFSGFLREYLPRLNYSFMWAGLEKFPLFKFADRASFRHAYNGSYKRVFKLNPGEVEELTTLQTISFSFRPLMALDLGWDKIWGGKLTFSANFDTQNDWASDYSFGRITSRTSSTLGINANFQKAGLSIPFLKLNLKNNFGATFTLSRSVSSDVYYTFEDILANPNGTSNGGITKTVVEPRFSYDINQQLTIEGFYRYERTTPASTGVLVPPTRTITAGFDIRLKVF